LRTIVADPDVVTDPTIPLTTGVIGLNVMSTRTETMLCWGTRLVHVALVQLPVGGLVPSGSHLI
jgi:hypothetical protein